MGKTEEEIEEALGQTVVDEAGNLSELPLEIPNNSSIDTSSAQSKNNADGETSSQS